jgi:hypothetical protein
MTTLLQRCQAVTAKVQQLTLAQRHANQQRQVQERTREWKSRHEKLKIVRARAACLPQAAEARTSVAEKRAHLRHNAAQVLERLKSLDDIAQLTDDASWTRLLASVESLADELETSGRSAWRSHIDEQGALEEPAWLRNRAPSTPMNDAAIAAYQTNYGAYAGLVKLPMPRSPDDLAQLSQLIAACRTEAAKITFDVPADVQRFFQAIQSGSATLASLTPGVLNWLAENMQLERYRIRSAGQ